MVRRNSVLITCGSERVKESLFCQIDVYYSELWNSLVAFGASWYEMNK